MGMRAERFRVISVLDPALDTEHQLTVEQSLEYARTRDFTLVDGKWVPGEEPTIFHVREIPNKKMETYVMAVGGDDKSSEALRFMRAFECGVYAVDNLVGDDGVKLPRWEPANRRNGQATMTGDECYRFSANERLEIGSVVYAHSFLHRKIAAYYQLPSSVLEHWAQRAYLPAAPSQTTASVPSNEKPSHAAEEAAPEAVA